MPEHWTYTACKPESDLEQGDILEVTGILQDLFKKVHPWFSDSKYLAFVVTTQTCDLRRHNGSPCSARYINLASVRGLEESLIVLLDTVCEKLGKRAYVKDDQRKAKLLLDRVFNQNEQKLGLFYLYPDADVGIGEDAVVFLRVSVAFRIEHYETIRKSRKGRLAPEFANKLGWLAGNLYSRIGTKDWRETRERKIKLDEMIRRYLDGGGGQSRLTWMGRADAKKLERQAGPLDKLPHEDVLEFQSKRREEFKKGAIDAVIKCTRDALPNAEPSDIEKLKRRLEADVSFSSLIKRP